MTAQGPDTRRPTWGELTSQSAQKRANAYPPSSRRLGKAEKPAARGLMASLRGNADRPPAPRSPEVTRVSCSFDKGENRLVDFTLPDLSGKPVRFQDLDADYVLIDFWGTWCGPCLQSIPHLVQLQNRYDPKRVRVLGVAYEQTDPADAARSVQGVMRKLAMNYPVLLGNTEEGPCPLQEAFHVQAYPTMVLVDRHGRILWRESGSTPATMTRLDRVIASNTKAGAGVVRR
jgi:thiol-disulfide isomerase/thioredoxin